MTVTFKLHQCYPGTWYIVTDTSAVPMAPMMNIQGSPGTAGLAEAGAASTVTVFGNGLTGPGAMGFQPAILREASGEPSWSPLWDHFTAVWTDPAASTSVTSAGGARRAGRLGRHRAVRGHPGHRRPGLRGQLPGAHHRPQRLRGGRRVADIPITIRHMPLIATRPPARGRGFLLFPRSCCGAVRHGDAAATNLAEAGGRRAPRGPAHSRLLTTPRGSPPGSTSTTRPRSSSCHADPARYAHQFRFFRQPAITVAGTTLSLDTLEHGLLRRSRLKVGLGYLGNPLAGRFERRSGSSGANARVHFALNCTAASCPPIAAYAPDRLDAQLDLATRAPIWGPPCAASTVTSSCRASSAGSRATSADPAASAASWPLTGTPPTACASVRSMGLDPGTRCVAGPRPRDPRQERDDDGPAH